MATEYNYDEIRSIINKEYLPEVFDLIFTESHFLFSRLKAKAKRYKTDKIVVPLKVAKMTNMKFMSKYGRIPVVPEEIYNAAEYSPAMLTGNINFPLQDELDAMSPEAVLDMIEDKMDTLRESIEDYWAEYIWTPGTSLPETDGWNTFDMLVNETAIGGIPASGSVPDWWKSKRVTLGDLTNFRGDPTKESDLLNPNLDSFLPKLIRRIVTITRMNSKKKPTLILLTRYLWDLLESILDPQKTGGILNQKAIDMGFDVIRKDGLNILADDDMYRAQASDTDGKILAVNEKFLWFYFHPSAVMRATDFVRIPDMNVKTANINTYGNFVTTNRQAHTVFEGVYSPENYYNPS